MVSMSHLVSSFKKEYGDTTVTTGVVMPDHPRLPTGVLEFDVASGGGFPSGCLSIIYGPESSGKTNLLLRTIARNQVLHPDKVNAFVDIEDSLNPEWAARLGVDVSKLIHLRPDYAEQAVDMIEGMLDSDDCGIVGVDSIAAMIDKKGHEKSAEDAIMGGIGIVMGRLSTKSTLAFRKAHKEGRNPTLIYINQVRTKVGFVLGNPETMPGGNAQKFQSQMTVRVSGKNVIDAKVSKVMPVKKETSFNIQKWKVPITATHGKFELVTIEHNGMASGTADDADTILAMLKTFGLVEKVKGGIQVEGSALVFTKQDALKDALRTTPSWAEELRLRLVTLSKDAGVLAHEIEEN